MEESSAGAQHHIRLWVQLHVVPRAEDFNFEVVVHIKEEQDEEHRAVDDFVGISAKIT